MQVKAWLFLPGVTGENNFLRKTMKQTITALKRLHVVSIHNTVKWALD